MPSWRKRDAIADAIENGMDYFNADMQGNKIVAAPNTDAVEVRGYLHKDVTPPVLTGFSLDLTSETLTLDFDETVNATSLDITQVTLQSTSSSLTSGYSNVATATTEEVVAGSSLQVRSRCDVRGKLKRDLS